MRLIPLEEVVEMFEARAVLEGLALRYAARHATEQEIADLQTIVERMEQCFAIGVMAPSSAMIAKSLTIC